MCKKIKPGTIIILNGTSSSGKTSILRALQNQLEDPYLEAGIDKFIWMMPKRYLNRPLWDDILGRADQAGETGHRLVNGMHHAVEALSRSGLNVIADHVLVEESWWRDCAERFSDLPAYLVAIRCPLEVLEQRERERKDRTLGQARLQYDKVHGLGIYDVEVDTSISSVDECTKIIMEYVCSANLPTALQTLNQTYMKEKLA